MSTVARPTGFWARQRHRLRRPFVPRTVSYIKWLWRRLRFRLLSKRALRMIFVKTKFGIEPVRNYLEDRKWGGWCGGTFDTSYDGRGVWGTSSADYSMLAKLFHEQNGVVITADDVLVDVGCGRGRVINYWLGLRLNNKIYGIELEERWAQEAAERVRRWPNVTIIHGDALEHIPPDGTIFYLFNPFQEPLVRAYRNRLLEVFGPGSEVTIVYHFALHSNVFAEDPRWVVEPVRTKTFHPSVIVRMAS